MVQGVMIVLGASVLVYDRGGTISRTESMSGALVPSDDGFPLQGYETFESCFKTITGRNILPYSTSDEGSTVMQWLSPWRR